MLLLPAVVFGKEKSSNDSTSVWNKQLITGFNISQVSYSNWVRGGESAVSWTTTMDAKFEKDTKQENWTTTSKLRYGQTKQENIGIRTTIDKIDFSTAYIYKYRRALNPFISGALRTQFSTGYKYSGTERSPRSDFIDPLYLIQSAGAGFIFSKALKVKIGGALKETFASTYAHLGYTDDPDTPEIEKYKIERGISSVTTFYHKFSKNFLVDSKLELFSAFDGINNVDIVFENTFTAYVAKYITVKFETLLYYDQNVSKEIQLKQTLGMGLSYSLF